MNNVFDHDDYEFSRRVYYVDPLKGATVGVGTKIPGENVNYEVVQVANNSDNGFQAMAVAPIVNGKPDTSQITIAYAGTNPGDPHDLLTDASQIPESNLGLAVATSPVGLVGSIVADDLYNGPSQFGDAQKFYDKVTKKYGDNSVKGTTGHSLGGALSLAVSTTNHIGAITFSAADPRNNVSVKDMQWVENHPGKIKNYYHDHDLVAAWQSWAGYGTSVKVKSEPDPKVKLLPTHMLESYRFADNGEVVLPDGTTASLPKGFKVDDAGHIVRAGGTIFTKKSLDKLTNAKSVSSWRTALSAGTVSGGEKVVVETELMLSVAAQLQATMTGVLQPFADYLDTVPIIVENDVHDLIDDYLAKARHTSPLFTRKEISSIVNSYGEHIDADSFNNAAEKINMIVDDGLALAASIINAAEKHAEADKQAAALFDELLK